MTKQEQQEKILELERRLIALEALAKALAQKLRSQGLHV